MANAETLRVEVYGVARAASGSIAAGLGAVGLCAKRFAYWANRRPRLPQTPRGK
jgi:hypothetical protein